MRKVDEQLRQLEEIVERARQSPTWGLEGLLYDITEQFYAHMQEQGITKAELALRLGKSRAWVSKLFEGNRNITLKSLVITANALGMEIAINAAPKGAPAAAAFRASVTASKKQEDRASDYTKPRYRIEEDKDYALAA